jgi:signal transduction histidine kinase
VHEALTNTLKHSKATRAKVSIKCDAATFEISTSDNGLGFDPKRIGASPEGPSLEAGNGLRNMRERLTEVGGYCQIESQPGHGATVRFIIPMNGHTHHVNG